MHRLQQLHARSRYAVMSAAYPCVRVERDTPGIAFGRTPPTCDLAAYIIRQAHRVLVGYALWVGIPPARMETHPVCLSQLRQRPGDVHLRDLFE
jgi:hypothetical protein